MTIDELLDAMQAILDTAKEEGERDLTDEEADRYEELEGQLITARRKSEIRSRQIAYMTPVRNDLHVNVAGAGDEEKHERAFEHYLRTAGDPRRGFNPATMAEYRAQSVGTNTAGGYLVPAGFRAKLVERMKEFGGIAEVAETLTTSEGNLISYPTIDDTANVAEIVAEGGTFAAGADLVFGTRTLSAYKYMAGGAGNVPLKVSWELLQDSAFDVSSFVARKLGERIARVQAVHWATGTGSGQPQGLVTPLTTIGAIASNAAGPTYAELLATVLALDPAYRSSARWVMNDATFGKIMALVDTTGRPLVNSSVDSISDTIGEPRLLGYPVTIDQAMPSAAASAKFLIFGDVGEAYVIRRVKDVTLVTLNEMYAANGQTGFMAWARADGAVQNVNAAVVRTAAA
jgi:HK97 family phage major capsid protein